MKYINVRDTEIVDIKKVNLLLKKNATDYFNYSIENRGGVLSLVELNFKPNTTTCMSIPLPVYNAFVSRINNVMGVDGVRGNDVLPIFIEEYEKYRRDYLGETTPIKYSSYSRYSSVLYLFWKQTEGIMGIKALLEPKRMYNIIENNDDNMKIFTNIESRGYKLKPTEHTVKILVDKSQKMLGEF